MSYEFHVNNERANSNMSRDVIIITRYRAPAGSDRRGVGEVPGIKQLKYPCDKKPLKMNTVDVPSGGNTLIIACPDAFSFA